jgi:hypothetical protein
VLTLTGVSVGRWLHADDGCDVCDAAGADQQLGPAAPHDAGHLGGKGGLVCRGGVQVFNELSTPLAAALMTA